jgi:hypothetical protein
MLRENRFFIFRTLFIVFMIIFLAESLRAQEFNIPASKWGISIGNSKKFNGLRINYRDNRVEYINGINITFWKPIDNGAAVVSGISLGVIPNAAYLNGISIGLLGAAADKGLNGINAGLLLGVNAAGDLNGITVGGLGIGGGGDIRGISAAGLGVWVKKNIYGIVLGPIGVGCGGDINGAVVGVLAPAVKM